jgi:hypothetical protein
MRKLVLAILMTVTASGAARAADQAKTNLFISPCGEPFVAAGSAPYPIVAWFAKADANHDGRLDQTEFNGDCERFFAVLDRNKDGVLDGGEISIYEHYLVPEILPSDRADAGGLLIRVALQQGDIGQIDPGGVTDTPPEQRQRLDTNQGAVQFSLFAAPEPVLSADRNLDGRVTLKEFQAQADRRFTTLDVAKRGYLLLADLPQTPAERAVRAKR